MRQLAGHQPAPVGAVEEAEAAGAVRGPGHALCPAAHRLFAPGEAGVLAGGHAVPPSDRLALCLRRAGRGARLWPGGSRSALLPLAPEALGPHFQAGCSLIGDFLMSFLFCSLFYICRAQLS